jgi:general secretion pathway protein L
VTKTSLLNEIYKVCESQGVFCVSIGAVGIEAPFVTFADPVAKANRCWTLTNILIFCATALWIIGNNLTHQNRLKADILGFEAEITALREEAFEMTELEQAKRTKEAKIDQILEKFQDGRATVEVLAVLTKILPDDTWVSEFHFSGNQLMLSGFTQQNVLELLGKLKSERLVQAADLVDSISSSRNSKTKRYSMRLTMAPKAEP